MLPVLKKSLIRTKRSYPIRIGSNPIVNMGTIFQPIPSFFFVIETANEPSPSVKPVTNQGFNLKPFLCIKDLILFGSFVIIVVFIFALRSRTRSCEAGLGRKVEYKRLFRI